MDKGYGWAILLWRKSIRRFFTSFSSDSSVGLADGRNRPCFCRPEGPLAQFYHSFNTLNTTLRTKSKMYSPVFILFTKIRAIDFCLTWFNSSWCCTYYTSSHLSSPTRMKSKSLRIFLCSLHKWISWVIRGLTDTSLRESTIHYSSHSYSELNYYLESLLHIDQDTTDLQNLESICICCTTTHSLILLFRRNRREHQIQLFFESKVEWRNKREIEEKIYQASNQLHLQPNSSLGLDSSTVVLTSLPLDSLQDSLNRALYYLLFFFFTQTFQA